MLKDLQKALESGDFVRIKRDELGEHLYLEGRVVALSEAVVVLLGLLDDRSLGGFLAIRVEDVTEVAPMRGAAPWSEIWAARGLPDAPEGLRLHGLASVVASIPREFSLVAIEQQDNPEVVWIGAPRLFDAEKLTLRHIDPDGQFYEDPAVYAWKDVSRVGFGGPYVTALAQVDQARRDGRLPTEPPKLPADIGFILEPGESLGPIRFDEPISAELRQCLQFQIDAEDGRWVEYGDSDGLIGIIEQPGRATEVVCFKECWFRGLNLVGLRESELRMLLADQRLVQRTAWNGSNYLAAPKLGLKLYLQEDVVLEVAATGSGDEPEGPGLLELATAAMEARCLVRVYREGLHDKTLDGIITGVTDTLLMLQRLGDNMQLDSYTVLRMADITELIAPKPYAWFAHQWLELAEQHPEPLAIDLRSWPVALRSAKKHFEAIALWAEVESPDVHYVGTPRVEADGVRLKSIDVDGLWLDGTDRFTWDEITRLDLGHPYESALHDYASTREDLS